MYYLLGINPGKSDTIDKITSIIVSEFKRVCVFNVTDDKATEGFIVKFLLFNKLILTIAANFLDHLEQKKLSIRAIVYASVWPQTYLWQHFIKDYLADYELLLQTHSFYSWMKWDAEIFNRTAAYLADNNVGLNVDIPQLKQFSEIELYGSFSNKERVLKSIYRYIRLPNFGQDDVACDFLQLAASKNNTVTEKALDESSKYLDAAYSSNEAYCAFQVRRIITSFVVIIYYYHNYYSNISSLWLLV